LNSTKITLLVGGVGGAKLAYGLAQIMPPENLTIIVNTGDDFWHYGLCICPDLDTITYTLSGLVNKQFGWGITDDSKVTLEALKKFGESPWFTLGDKDLATHLFRTQRLREGQTLTQITRHITTHLGIDCTILPMSDDPIATMVDTVEHGVLGFQEYFVKHRWQPTLKAINLEGANDAQMSAEVETAINNADAIIIGPSNPWLSIQPILSVPGLNDAIIRRNVPRIAVTPIINGEAVKGPTAKIMRELGYDVSATAVMEFYRQTINSFVFDKRDNIATIDGIFTIMSDTYMDTDEKRVQLAQNILDWIEDLLNNDDLGNYPG